MRPTTSVPHSVLEAGLPARFRYWSGQSGARYLFTQTDLSAIAHFDDAIVIVGRFGRVIWAGHTPDYNCASSDLAMLAGRDGSDLYVHLLARSADDRLQIIEDLKAVIHIEQADIGGPARILEFPVAA